MTYTRLSINFQPKTKFFTRRFMLLAGFYTCTGVNQAWSLPMLLTSNTPNTVAAPPMTNSIQDENGKSFNIDTFKGKPLLINFWASWCAPCIAEMPSLQKAAEKLQAESIKVLLISVDRGGSRKALPVLLANGVSEPSLGFDPKALLSREMGVKGLPTSFLLSADQKKCLRYLGPREWDSEKMQNELMHFVISNERVSKST